MFIVFIIVICSYSLIRYKNNNKNKLIFYIFKFHILLNKIIIILFQKSFFYSNNLLISLTVNL